MEGAFAFSADGETQERVLLGGQVSLSKCGRQISEEAHQVQGSQHVGAVAYQAREKTGDG